MNLVDFYNPETGFSNEPFQPYEVMLYSPDGDLFSMIFNEDGLADCPAVPEDSPHEKN